MTPGGRAWVALAVCVAGYDAVAELARWDTLSSAFRAAPRALTIPAAVFVMAHLFGLVPSRFDPLCRVGAVLSGDRRR